ncbi:MAG: hypothetical protein PHP01_02255 [Phycisphaerae bacterium]|nr:hypothetical protein [Phycisphaerae bacterium]
MMVITAIRSALLVQSAAAILSAAMVNAKSVLTDSAFRDAKAAGIAVMATAATMMRAKPAKMANALQNAIH